MAGYAQSLVISNVTKKFNIKLPFLNYKLKDLRINSYKMKYIVLFLFLISCKSGGDNELMKTKLFIHNKNAALKYQYAEIDAETNSQIKYMKYKGDSDYQNLIDLELKSFRLSWNKPYDIQKDSALTYEKYEEYCKAHGYDKETYINYIDAIK